MLGLGHRRGHACGWTGHYKELKRRRAEPGVRFPVCTCPQCGHTVAIRDTVLRDMIEPEL